MNNYEFGIHPTVHQHKMRGGRHKFCFPLTKWDARAVDAGYGPKNLPPECCVDSADIPSNKIISDE